MSTWNFDDDWGGAEPAVAPVLMQLGLTYRCNLNCQHCYALFRRTREEFTEEEARSLIDAAYDLGTFKVVYSHGENLIRQDFHQIAKYISDKGLFQTLMTNGFYLQTPDSVKRLEETGIQKVMISLDSVEPSEHNENRGNRKAFDWATNAIETLQANTRMKLGISMAIDRRNYHHVEEMAALAERLNIDHVSFMQVRPNQPHNFAAYDWSDYEKLCHELYDLIIAYRGRVDLYTHDPFMLTLMDERLSEQEAEDFVAHNVCNAGKYMISVTPDGDVTGCNFIERTVGNCRDEPLSVIWQRLVKDSADAPDGTPCESCSKFQSCRTGCKAFHLPWNDKYDKRCMRTRFADLVELEPTVQHA